MTAVVIGASSGIGEALARELNDRGWRLGLLARRVDRLEALRDTLAPGTAVRGLDVYLDGLRDLAQRSGLPIAVTEAQPGAVETAMLKPARPLPSVARHLLVASPEKAARQILRAVAKRKKHAYITGRYAPIAFLLKLLPRPG